MGIIVPRSLGSKVFFFASRSKKFIAGREAKMAKVTGTMGTGYSDHR